MMSHYHVTTNAPGFIASADTYCVFDSEDVIDVLRTEITSLGLDTLEGCDRDGCGHCAWCRSGKHIMARVSDRTKLQRWVETALEGGSNLTLAFSVPCAPKYVIEVKAVSANRPDCKHNLD